MSEMIERVAEAICRAENGEVGVNGCRECLLGYTAGVSAAPKNCLGVYSATARAAIEAMREPTDAMMLAACHAGNEDMEASWRVAIDEALT